MWTKDNKSIFYVTKDDLDRPYKVKEIFWLLAPKSRLTHCDNIRGSVVSAMRI